MGDTSAPATPRADGANRRVGACACRVLRGRICDLPRAMRTRATAR
jgi:hypothetical protein